MGKRLALITGGTSGIGYGAATRLAPDYDLALCYGADTERAKQAEQSLLETFPDCRVRLYQKKLTGYQDAKQLAETVDLDFKIPPSVVVLSHGRLRDGLFLNTDFSQHEATIAEHLVVNMALVHLFLKSMYRERFGRFVLLSSISARYAKRGQVNYAAAKAGIEALVRTVALEIAHRGVTINAVAPGLIETPMTAGLTQQFATGERDLRKTIPTGFIGTPDDVGELIAFLCSDKARYITGATYTIDGGRSLGDCAS